MAKKKNAAKTPRIKPCPICGGKACRSYLFRIHACGHAVVCDKLSCRTNGPVRRSSDAAIAAWNKRV